LNDGLYEVIAGFCSAAFSFAYGVINSRKAAKYRIKTLRIRLLKDGYKWRSLSRLARAIGQISEATTALHLEIGARRNALERDVWTLEE
jgi:HEPN domain-containing protein